ncbi:uvrD REP helicase, putative [Babesia ovata]|uniref:UvrD REP helicase, putative n=1 Tax=Babesia ovata TaxID=189622 RepID=A0A2H6KEV2_9APIC|nr:uvrD REP helicase, putative [Babesia ovata]GBE61528.1 uvrD REP helicase, putative [Babesia ovata]
MAEFLARAVNDAQNVTKLKNALDNKIDGIRQEAENGFDTPSSIFLGPLYDEMLIAVAGEDMQNAQKWLLAIAFVIKSETLRYQRGLTVPESASEFFDGVIAKILDTLEALEDKPSIVKEDLWRTLKESFEFILIPDVAAVVKCHRRLANRAFKFVLQTASTENTEQLTLRLIRWMCSTRTFDSEKSEDAVYLNQLRMLQSSANDRTSKDASDLMLKNVKTLSKRDLKALPAFINSNMKHLAKEIELGATENLVRPFHLMKATFDACRRSDANVVIDLVPLWKMFEAFFEQMHTYDSQTTQQAFDLLSVVAKWLCPDLVLVNIPYLGGIIARIFDHHVDTLVKHSESIEGLLTVMNELCPDFYLLASENAGRLIETLISKIDRSNLQDAHRLIGIISHVNGESVGHKVENLILRLVEINEIHWADASLTHATLRLIHRHLSRGETTHNNNPI